MADNGGGLTLHAGALSLHELHDALADCAPDTQVVVHMNQQLSGFGAGLEQPLTMVVEGNVGDFAFLMSDRAEVEVKGNVGISCGHSFVSGSIVVRGAAGAGLAAFAMGGFIAVHGTAGDRCGLGLSGADVFVRSTVGNAAGFNMKAGTLVLGNGAGENVGQGMTGGLIYIRGEVKSVADCARQVRMKDAESLRLGLFLARAGIKAGGADFRVYRARQEVKS